MIVAIDSKPCACEPGEYILDIAKRNGITIPTLCHHDGLPGQGCCRVCIVEVEAGGRSSIVTACVYPVKRECSVFTSSEKVSRQRRMVLSLLRSMAPESDMVKNLCEEYGAPEHGRFIEKTGEKCIMCGLCVRACESLGTGAIATVNRGVAKAVATAYDEPSIACVGCASCASVCPTGTIGVADDGRTRTIWGKTFFINECARCGSPMGTLQELWRTAVKAGAGEAPDLCENCRKKAIADVMAAAFGR